jgi:hypothetical protein
MEIVIKLIDPEEFLNTVYENVLWERKRFLLF